jgi:hypothetical protein
VRGEGCRGGGGGDQESGMLPPYCLRAAVRPIIQYMIYHRSYIMYYIIYIIYYVYVIYYGGRARDSHTASPSLSQPSISLGYGGVCEGWGGG